MTPKHDQKSISSPQNAKPIRSQKLCTYPTSLNTLAKVTATRRDDLLLEARVTVDLKACDAIRDALDAQAVHGAVLILTRDVV